MKEKKRRGEKVWYVESYEEERKKKNQTKSHFEPKETGTLSKIKLPISDSE